MVRGRRGKDGPGEQPEPVDHRKGQAPAEHVAGLRRPPNAILAPLAAITSPYRYVYDAGTLLVTDRTILLDHEEEIALELPANAPDHTLLIIKDAYGRAEEFQVDIVAPSGEQIDGQASFTVDVDFMALHVVKLGSTDWFVI